MNASTPSRSDVMDLIVELGDEAYLGDTDTIPYAEVEARSLEIGLSVPTPVIRGLRELGILVGPRAAGPTRTRGYRSSSNDRWWGPGSSASHGGSGGGQITGFAGRVG